MPFELSAPRQPLLLSCSMSYTLLAVIRRLRKLYRVWFFSIPFAALLKYSFVILYTHTHSPLSPPLYHFFYYLGVLLYLFYSSSSIKCHLLFTKFTLKKRRKRMLMPYVNAPPLKPLLLPVRAAVAFGAKYVLPVRV